MDDPEAAAREAERAFTEAGANGLQLYSNVKGKPLDLPEFLPVFEMAARHDKPILLHPIRGADMPDYKSEDRSKYEIWWTFGWPYETSAAMARIVFSGLLDRLPELKIVAHHLGAMVPYFEGRVGPGWDQLGTRTSDEDLGAVLKRLKRRPLDYFKDFYADTAVFGSRAATVCGLEFYRARPGPVRLRLALRPGERTGLHPRHDRGAGIDRPRPRSPRQDQPPQRRAPVRPAAPLTRAMPEKSGSPAPTASLPCRPFAEIESARGSRTFAKVAEWADSGRDPQRQRGSSPRRRERGQGADAADHAGRARFGNLKAYQFRIVAAWTGVRSD